MLPVGFKFQLIWISSILLYAEAYHFNNGYMAIRENREQPVSTGNYNFEYSEKHEDSNSFRKEKRVGNRVTGEYGFKLPDGRMRLVRFIADENGYRTLVDSNEMPNNPQPNNWSAEQFESERLGKYRAHELQQLEQQKELLNNQIRLQQRMHEQEIRRQNEQLSDDFQGQNVENEQKRNRYEEKGEAVYVAPLPNQDDWTPRVDITSHRYRYQAHQRADKEWIAKQRAHLEEQQIARQRAEEKRAQEEMIERIRQKQLLQQQRIFQERQAKRERQLYEQQQQFAQKKSSVRKSTKINANRLEYVTQRQENDHQRQNEEQNQHREQLSERRTSGNVREHQWWLRENEKRQEQENRQFSERLRESKEERKIDVQVPEVRLEIEGNENNKNQIERSEIDKNEIARGEIEINRKEISELEVEKSDEAKFETNNNQQGVKTEASRLEFDAESKQGLKKAASDELVEEALKNRQSTNELKGGRKVAKIEIKVRPREEQTGRLIERKQFENFGNREMRIVRFEGDRKGGNSNESRNRQTLERRPNWVAYGRTEKGSDVRGKTSPINSTPTSLDTFEQKRGQVNMGRVSDKNDLISVTTDQLSTSQPDNQTNPTTFTPTTSDSGQSSSVNSTSITSLTTSDISSTTSTTDSATITTTPQPSSNTPN